MCFEKMRLLETKISCLSRIGSHQRDNGVMRGERRRHGSVARKHGYGFVPEHAETGSLVVGAALPRPCIVEIGRQICGHGQHGPAIRVDRHHRAQRLRHAARRIGNQRTFNGDRERNEARLEGGRH